MIGRIVLAVVVALAVGLLCLLLGAVLGALNVPIAETVGHWFREFAWVLGILAGVWYFITGTLAP